MPVIFETPEFWIDSIVLSGFGNPLTAGTTQTIPFNTSKDGHCMGVVAMGKGSQGNVNGQVQAMIRHVNNSTVNIGDMLINGGSSAQTLECQLNNAGTIDCGFPICHIILFMRN